jgi:hypothetical protein
VQQPSSSGAVADTQPHGLHHQERKETSGASLLVTAHTSGAGVAVDVESNHDGIQSTMEQAAINHKPASALVSLQLATHHSGRGLLQSNGTAGLQLLQLSSRCTGCANMGTEAGSWWPGLEQLACS